MPNSVYNLAADLIIDIFCKLEYNSLNIISSNKRFLSILYHNKRFILKRIINSYNLIPIKSLKFCISFLNKYKPIDRCLMGIVRHDNKNFDGIRFLLKNGLDANFDNGYLLGWAVDFNKVSLINFLISNDHVNIHTDNDIALRWAAYNGYFKLVKLFVKKGADIHINLDNPLRYAAQNGYFRIVKFLIESGANVTTLNNYAIHLASANRNHNIVRLLIENGAILN